MNNDTNSFTLLTEAPTNVALAVLAGGAGSRMGMPKAQLTLAGKPILKYLLERWQWVGPTLLVTAAGRTHPPGWTAFTREVFDAVSGQGPLRGILTALDADLAPVTIVTNVDMPCVSATQLIWLLRELTSRPEAIGVMCALPARAQGSVMPFPCAFRTRAAADRIRKRLELGQRDVHSLANTGIAQPVETPEYWSSDTWINLNRPQDVEAFEATGRRRRPPTP